MTKTSSLVETHVACLKIYLKMQFENGIRKVYLLPVMTGTCYYCCKVSSTLIRCCTAYPQAGP